MKRWVILIFLLSSFCFAGASYYKITGVADDDTISVRQSASALSKWLQVLSVQYGKEKVS